MISDVSNKVKELTGALGQKDEQINQLKQVVDSLQLSMSYMKLDFEKNEQSRK